MQCQSLLVKVHQPHPINPHTHSQQCPAQYARYRRLKHHRLYVPALPHSPLGLPLLLHPLWLQRHLSTIHPRHTPQTMCIHGECFCIAIVMCIKGIFILSYILNYNVSSTIKKKMQSTERTFNNYMALWRLGAWIHEEKYRSHGWQSLQASHEPPHTAQTAVILNKTVEG